MEYKFKLLDLKQKQESSPCHHHQIIIAKKISNKTLLPWSSSSISLNRILLLSNLFNLKKAIVDWE